MEIHVEMKKYHYMLFLLLVGLGATGMKAQEVKYPPLSEYMMTQDEGVALRGAPRPKRSRGAQR